MYTLTLTREERAAIDWVGNRYRHGDELYKCLSACEWITDTDDFAWSDPGLLTIRIPEHIAWEIAELIRDSQLDCFGADLIEKLLDFADSIV